MVSSDSHFLNLEQGRFTRPDGRYKRLTTSKDYAFDCKSRAGYGQWRWQVAAGDWRGGQAVVGVVESPGGGDQPKSQDQPHAKQIAHAPQPAVWSADKKRQPLPVSGDAERPLPDARRDVPGRPEG
jgi:hypothetical protein